MTKLATARKDGRERRRQRCLLVANLVYGAEQLTVGATVRDLNEQGCRARLVTMLPLPSRLTILLGRDGDAYEAEVMWKNVPEIGLKFLTKVDATQKTDDPNAAVLRRLWLTMAGRSTSSVLTESERGADLRAIAGELKGG